MRKVSLINLLCLVVGVTSSCNQSADNLGADSASDSEKTCIPQSGAPQKIGFWASPAAQSEGGLYFFSKNGEQLSIWKTDGISTDATEWFSYGDNPTFDLYSEMHGVSVNGNLVFNSTDKKDSATWAVNGQTGDITQLIETYGQPVLFGVIDDKAIIIPRLGPIVTTDGSAENTHEIFKTDNVYLRVTELEVLNNKGIWVNAKSLWTTDGTEGGTFMLKELTVTTSLVPFKNELFFGVGDTLWKTDGTDAGTLPVFNETEQDATKPSDIHHLCATDQRLFFIDRNGEERDRLWSSNGTAEGTSVVAEVGSVFEAGVDNFDMPIYWFYDYQLIAGSTGVFFRRTTDGVEQQLWASDGTSAGTHFVTTICTDCLDIHGIIAALGTQILFVAPGDKTKTALWAADNSGAKKQLFDDNLAVEANTGSLWTQKVNNKLYFAPTEGNGLYFTDGTAQGTIEVQNPHFPTDSDCIVDIH